MKKINQFRKIAGMLFLALSLSYCSKDDSCTIEQEGGNKVDEKTEVALNQLRGSVLDKLEQKVVFTLDDTDEFTFVSEKGVTIVGNSLGYWKDGAFVNTQPGDKVELTFIELFDRGNMALTNRPTMGIYPEMDMHGDPLTFMNNKGRVVAIGKKAFIATGGEFYIDLKINGQLATIYHLQMSVPYKNTNGFQENMKFWQGTVDDKNDLTFIEFPMTTEMGEIEENEELQSYDVNIMNFDEELRGSSIGWVNIDKYMDYEGEKTQLFVKVPEGYNGTNAAVYAFFKGQEGLAQLDVFIKHKELGYVYTEHYGWVPVGFEAYLIFMSVDPKTKEVVYAVKQTKITKNQAISILDSELKRGTSQDVKNILNGLK